MRQWLHLVKKCTLSVQDGIVAFGNVWMPSIPSLGSPPKVAIWTAAHPFCSRWYCSVRKCPPKVAIWTAAHPFCSRWYCSVRKCLNALYPVSRESSQSCHLNNSTHSGLVEHISLQRVKKISNKAENNLNTPTLNLIWVRGAFPEVSLHPPPPPPPPPGEGVIFLGKKNRFIFVQPYFPSVSPVQSRTRFLPVFYVFHHDQRQACSLPR